MGSYPAYITHVIIFGQLRILNFILFLLYFCVSHLIKIKRTKRKIIKKKFILLNFEFPAAAAVGKKSSAAAVGSKKQKEKVLFY